MARVRSDEKTFFSNRRSLLSFFLSTILFYEEYRPCIFLGLDIICDYHYHQMIMRMNNFLYKPEAVQSVDRRPLAAAADILDKAF